MTTDKQEIDRIINEIICNGNYWAKKFGTDGFNIGGFIWAIDAGRLTPPSWPKFDANWLSNEFYIGALNTEHLHEWLEHLFRLKLGEPEPDMFWRAGEEDELTDDLEEFAQRVLDKEGMDSFETIIVDVQCAKMLRKRKMKIVNDYDGSVKSLEWVE